MLRSFESQGLAKDASAIFFPVFFVLIDVAMQRALKLLAWRKEVQKWPNRIKCVLYAPWIQQAWPNQRCEGKVTFNQEP